MSHSPDAEPAAGATVAWLPLGLGIGLMLAITAYPPLLTDADGKADHLAAGLACWAMAAGLTRGVGYLPVNVISRVLLSGSASLLALLLTVARLAYAHG